MKEGKSSQKKGKASTEELSERVADNNETTVVSEEIEEVDLPVASSSRAKKKTTKKTTKKPKSVSASPAGNASAEKSVRRRKR